MTRKHFLLVGGATFAPVIGRTQTLPVSLTSQTYAPGAPVMAKVATPVGGSVGVESQLTNSSFSVAAAIPSTNVNLGPAKNGAHPVRMVVGSRKYAATVFLFSDNTTLRAMVAEASAGSEHPASIDEAALKQFWTNFTSARFAKASKKLLDWAIQNNVGIVGTSITCMVVTLVPAMTMACIVGVALKAADALVSTLLAMVDIQKADGVLKPDQAKVVSSLLGFANAAIQVGEITAASGIIAKLAAGAGAGVSLLAEADFPAAKFSLKLSADGVQKYTGILDILKKL